MEHVNLEEFVGGAFTVKVNRAISEVMENINDANADINAARKIAITIAFKANPERSFVQTAIQVKTTLAPETAAVTAFATGRDLKTGKVVAKEIGNQIPGQMTLNLQAAEIVDEPKTEKAASFDTETGEILSGDPAETGKVIDMRKLREG